MSPSKQTQPRKVDDNGSRRLDGSIDPSIPFDDRFDRPQDLLLGAAFTQLDDDVPLLLLPVRVETKYRLDHEPPQLLVRIYPDEIHIDRDEPQVTDEELSEARQFWTERHASSDARAASLAWGQLVDRVGPRRAHRAAERCRPTIGPRGSLVFPTSVPGAAHLRLAGADDARRSASQPPTALRRVPEKDGPGKNTPRKDVPGRDVPGRDLPGKGLPGKGLPDSGRPGTGRPGTGRPGTGLPGKDRPGTSLPDKDRPGTGLPDKDLPGTGLPDKDPPDKDLPDKVPPVDGPHGPRAALLPGQWVVTGFDDAHRVLFRRGSRAVVPNLATGLTAAAPTWEVGDSGVVVDDNLAWMVDFDRAVECGMAVAIDLVDAAAPAKSGVALLTVIGVDAELGPQATADAVSALLDSHAANDRLEFVGQGTATNNTDTAASGWASASTEPAGPAVDGGAAQRAVKPGSTKPLDQIGTGGVVLGPDPTNAFRFGRLLGLGDGGSWRNVAGALDYDYAESHAMRSALFEATMGVMLRKLWEYEGSPGIAGTTISSARDWFIDHITGGAPIPALRIGAQPYGFLPVRNPSSDPDLDTVAGQVERICGILRPEWDLAVGSVPAIDHGATDSSTDLAVEDAIASILATQPHPSRLAWRRFEGYDELSAIERALTPQRFYELALLALNTDTNPNLEPPFTQVAILYLTTSFLLDVGNDIDEQIAQWQVILDELPATLAQQNVDDPDDEAADFVEVVRSIAEAFATRRWPMETIGIDDLRVTLGQLTSSAGEYSASTAPSNEIVQAKMSDNTSEWGDVGLVQAADAPPGHTAAEYLHDLNRRFGTPLGMATENALPSEFIAHPPLLYQLLDSTLALAPRGSIGMAAMDNALQRLAGLSPERLEWLMRETLGLGTHRLDAWNTSLAADRLDEIRGTATGVSVGAYGMVTDLVPSTVNGESQGFVHAPSMGQAGTAAMLRAGWQASGSSDPNSPYAVDLASSRVRDARWLLDGVGRGQPLGELLGCRFERRLHDDGLDRLIRPVREQVLSAQGRGDTSADQPVDGIELIDLVRSNLTLPQEAAGALASIEASFDAANDLAIAEGVHQLAAGSYGRASAMLDAVATGTRRAPDAEVVRTQRPVTTIEHRVMLLVEANLDSVGGWPVGLRGTVAPELERWVESLVPAPSDVGFSLLDGAGTVTYLTLADLDLGALDAIWLVSEDPSQPSDALLTLAAAHTASDVVSVDLGLPGGTRCSLADFAVLAVELRRLIARARVGDGRDVRAGHDSGEPGLDESAIRPRVDVVEQAFDTAIADLRAALSSGQQVAAAASALASFGLSAPRGSLDPDLLTQVLATAEARQERLLGTWVFDEGPRKPGPLGGSGAPPDKSPPWRTVRGLPFDPSNPTNPGVPHRQVPTDDERVALLFSHGLPLLAPFVLAGDVAPEPVAFPDDGLADRTEIDEWLEAMSRVRADIGHLHQVGLLADAIDGRAFEIVAGQTPRLEGDRWAATSLPVDRSNRLCVTALTTGATPTPGDAVCALVFDRWAEQIPSDEQVTGVAFHFDAPSNQAPHVCLVHVLPPGESWTITEVDEMLFDTLAWTKRRAVASEDLALSGRSIPSTFVPGSIIPWPTESEDVA